MAKIPFAVATALLLLSCAVEPAGAQTYLAFISEANGFGVNAQCPPGSRFAVRTVETMGVNGLPTTTICIRTTGFANDAAYELIQQQSATLAAQGQNITELMARNALLEKSLKTVSEALDALTARLDKMKP